MSTTYPISHATSNSPVMQAVEEISNSINKFEIN